MDANLGAHRPRALTVLAALVIVIAGLKAAGPLLLPFLFAGFLAVMAAPSVLWLERRGIPPAVAVVPTVVVMLAALAILGTLLTASIQGFVEVAPGYSAALEQRSAELFGSLGVNAPAQWHELVGPDDVIEMVGALATAMLSALSNTALVLLTLLFMLLEVAGLGRKLVAAFGADRVDGVGLATVLRDVQRYLAIKSVISGLTGLLVLALSWGVGLDFPLVWGMLAFLFNFIPNVGGFIAAIPAILVALVQPQLGVPAAAVLAIGHSVIHLVVGNVLEPAWMGRKLGMSALVVFLSLVFWGWVWGPVGMLLSVPLTMVVKILLERSAQGRAVAVLLGPAGDPA